jgi:hypothetical protein
VTPPARSPVRRSPPTERRRDRSLLAA